MKKYLKEFLIRGLLFGGFGPIILAIIYFIISKINKNITFTGSEIFLGTVSIYLLAFVHAGASVFNQIEEWGINKSVGVHFVVLYFAYSACYLLNTWIPFDGRVFLIFTGIFVAVYAVVWTIVYLCVRNSEKKLNSLLNNK
ncbi:MAG: DUF3021 domain-containing protein [Clostridia bacterium]|nr:DUF3021 domain-containing protein [Clostridia bacterium]